MNHVIVIGAGLGGLAAAVRLAHGGYRVTVLEKNARVGGKMDIWQEGGFTFDTGPSLLTMPFVLQDLFTDLGLRREDYLDLVPLAPVCRYFFPDGVTRKRWKMKLLAYLRWMWKPFSAFFYVKKQAIVVYASIVTEGAYYPILFYK